MMTSETVMRATILTVAVMAGNLLGLRLRDRLLDDKRAEMLEIGSLLVCVTLSLLGVGKGG